MKFALTNSSVTSPPVSTPRCRRPTSPPPYGPGDRVTPRRAARSGPRWPTISASPRSRCRRSSTVSRRTRRIWWSRSSGWAGGAFPVRSPNRLRWRPSCSAAETNGPNGRRHWRPVSWSPRWHCRPQSRAPWTPTSPVDTSGPGRPGGRGHRADAHESVDRRESCSMSTPPAPPNPPTWPGPSNSGFWRRPPSWSARGRRC